MIDDITTTEHANNFRAVKRLENEAEILLTLWKTRKQLRRRIL